MPSHTNGALPATHLKTTPELRDSEQDFQRANGCPVSIDNASGNSNPDCPIIYEREDWELFGDINTLCQKLGVRLDLIPRLVVKELVDNALDHTGDCSFGSIGDGDPALVGFFVEDEGGGIDGSDESIARLFSIGRPLLTSKLGRLPTRGAMGNGARGVAGAVLTSNGELVVKTRGRALQLRPQLGGTTLYSRIGSWSGPGTRIEVVLGQPLSGVGDNIFEWAEYAQLLAGKGKTYSGRPSPHFHDVNSFFQLTRAAKNSTVREVVERLEGCSGRKASDIVGDTLMGRRAYELSRKEAAAILTRARKLTEAVGPSRLGFVGRLPGYEAPKKREGFITVGQADSIPFVVEAWAKPAKGNKPNATLCVNRTPCTSDVSIVPYRDGTVRWYVFIVAGGFEIKFRVRKASNIDLLINIQCPAMPITNDGKAPDLSQFRKPIGDAMSDATRALQRKIAQGTGRGVNLKTLILSRLQEAMQKASGDYRYRYSLRQLFYAVRPFILDAGFPEPKYDTFTEVIRSHERDLGQDLRMIYRDNRGSIYHPHTGETIPLGTLSVERYRRPMWTFNKIVYCEKEGFFPILMDAKWPERHDCALATSKGYGTNAVSDLLDVLEGSDEPIRIFCVHDADGYGTRIYQSMVEAVQARSGRKVEIINLGLEPWEAVDMGLQVERLARGPEAKAVPYANYVTGDWREWLQRNRVELNAMMSEEFIAWLDRKIAPYEKDGKLLPPLAVGQTRLDEDVAKLIRDRIVDRLLREANIDDLVEQELKRLAPTTKASADSIRSIIAEALRNNPELAWWNPVREEAVRIAFI